MKDLIAFLVDLGWDRRDYVLMSPDDQYAVTITEHLGFWQLAKFDEDEGFAYFAEGFTIEELKEALTHLPTGSVVDLTDKGSASTIALLLKSGCTPEQARENVARFWNSDKEN